MNGYTAMLQQFAETAFGRFLLEQNVVLLAPELILLLTILLTIVLSVSKQVEERQGTWLLAFVGVVLSLACLVFQGAQFLQGAAFSMPAADALFGMVRLDSLAFVARILLLLATAIVLLLTKRYVSKRFTAVPGEFYSLFLTALLGALFLSSSIDLVMLFVSLETLGIMSYLLVGFLRNDKPSTEASLKYLLYGGTSSAIFLFGASLLYGMLGGSTNLLAGISAQSAQSADLITFLPIMVLMLMAGMGFKLASAPFHWWTPDVYEGSPTPVAAFLSVVSKVAAFVFSLRLISMLVGFYPDILWILGVLAVLSMILGNTVALFQNNIKRLLGYSTVAHVGYMLLGLVVLSQSSLAGLLFYLATYLFMNLGAFASVIKASEVLGSDKLEAYSGLVKKKPILVLCFSVFLLALAGIPITAGFFAKFFLFQSVMFSGTEFLPLIIIALLASTVSLAYYLNVMRVMIIGVPSPEVEAIDEEPGLRLVIPSALSTGLAICLLGTLLLGFIAPPLYSIFQQTAKPFGLSRALLTMQPDIQVSK